MKPEKLNLDTIVHGNMPLKDLLALLATKIDEIIDYLK